MNNEKILNIKINSCELGGITIKEFFKQAMAALWIEGESFSGKRPFGNSGWEYPIYAALVKNGILDGSLDSDGYVEECNTAQADKIILEAIKSL